MGLRERQDEPGKRHHVVNTGIAIASQAAVKGYKAILVMSEIVRVERQRVLEALGAEVILTPKEHGTKGANARAKETAPFLSQGIFAPHRILGTAPGFRPGIYDPAILDEFILISEEDAFAACREIARTEGLLVGATSGATALAARRIGEREGMEGKMIACVFADTGERYLSMGIY